MEREDPRSIGEKDRIIPREAAASRKAKIQTAKWGEGVGSAMPHT